MPSHKLDDPISVSATPDMPAANDADYPNEDNNSNDTYYLESKGEIERIIRQQEAGISTEVDVDHIANNANLGPETRIRIYRLAKRDVLEKGRAALKVIDFQRGLESGGFVGKGEYHGSVVMKLKGVVSFIDSNNAITFTDPNQSIYVKVKSVGEDILVFIETPEERSAQVERTLADTWDDLQAVKLEDFK